MPAASGQTGPVTTSRRINIIVNPAAGGYRRTRLERIVAQVSAEVRIIETRYAGHARELVGTLPPEVPLFVAGGDGTINEVVNGLLDAGNAGQTMPPVGIVPTGTANVLACEIGIGNRVAEIARYINDAVAVPVVPGMCNGRAFMLMAGAGPDAVTVAAVSARLKAWLGKWAYVWQGLCTILHPPETMILVRAGGQTYRSAGVIVTRARHYGGPFVVTPDAGLLRPELAVVLLASNRSSDLLRYAVGLVSGRLAAQPGYRVFQASEVTLSCAPGDRPTPIQIDGDPDGNVEDTLPCRIGLAPRAIRLLVPDDFKQSGQP